MSQWYYSEGDQQKGPVSQAELQAMIDAGRVKGDDLIWTSGQSDWKPARHVAAFRMPSGSADPPASSNRPSSPGERAPLPAPASSRRRRFEDEDEEYDDRPRRRRRSSTTSADTLAIVSLVTGILSLVTSCFCYFLPVMPIVAIVTGVMGMKSEDKRGMGIAGLILGALGLLISLALIVIVVIAIANDPNGFKAGGPRPFGR